MLRRLLNISLLLFLILGCNKYKPDPLTGDFSYLIGTWDWDSTFHRYNWCTGGATLEQTIYPESEGDNFSIIFTETGEIWFFSNGAILETDSITISHFEQTGDERYMVIHKNGDSENITSVRGTFDQTSITNFPFKPYDTGCENYNNYFSKR